jgi:superfamily II DNA helicase RecQ
MDQFNTIFQHWPEYRVIHCRQCRFCPVPTQIQAHLDTHHAQIAPRTRRRIAEAAQSIPREQVAYQPDDVVYPPADNPPIDGLVVYRNAYQCQGEMGKGQQCRQIRRHIKKIQAHCKEAHQWKNIQKRGGNSHHKQHQTPNRIWRDGVSCQRFFEFGAWQRYFAVEPPQDGLSIEKVDDLVRRGEQMLAQQQQVLAEFQQTKKIQPNNHRYEFHQWLKRAGWAQHLSQYEPAELVEMVEVPQREGDPKSDAAGECEPELWRACQVTVRAIRQAQKVCHPQIVGYPALEFINRRETGQVSNEKPFYAGQMGKTITKYSRHLVRILCYIWSTHDDDSPPPPYRLTSRQKSCLTLFQDRVRGYEAHPSEEGYAGMNTACVAFWISLADHELKDHEYDSALVSGAAVLGWHAAKKTWRTPLNYPPILSGIVTVFRMLVVSHAHSEREQDIQRLQVNGFGEDEARQRARSHFALVKSMVHRFMTLTAFGGKPSPMNFLLRLRTYGFNIRMNTPADGAISWHGDEIQCGSVRFTMAKLRRMIHGLVEQLWLRLRRDILLLDVTGQGEIRPGSAPLPRLDLDQLFDNPSETQDGWSFLKDPRNSFEVDGRQWLHGRILREARLRRRFIDVAASQGKPDGPVQWKAPAIQQHFRAVTDWKRDLLVAVEACAGGVWRGTEVLTLQHRNSTTNWGRGILIDGGMVQLVSAYHKNAGHSGRSKIIHHFMPQEIGSMIVYFLWLGHPPVETMQGYLTGQREFSPFMWEPRKNEGDDEDEADEFEDEPEVMMDFEVPEAGEESEERVEREQAARAPEEAVALNVDGFWNSERFRYALERATMAGMGVKVSILALRHCFKAIMREYSRDRRVQEIINDEHDLGMGQDDIRDLAFGHGTHVAGMIYGRDLMEAPFHTVTQREGFRRVSIEWHRFLQFASAMDMEFPHPTIRGLGSVRVAPHVQQEQQRRWQAMQRVDLRQALRQVVQNEEAEFRGCQQEVLTAIVARKGPIVAVMPTSIGKSMLFQLPAAMNPAGITVVIVPLNSLEDNMRDRCTRMGIRCAEWHPHQPPDDAQIVLVTPEGTTSEAFHHFVNRQRALGRLDRIVFDESHTVLDSVDGWRPRVRQVIELSAHQTQLVYLTATLAPTDEDQFFRMTGIYREAMTMFRTATTRPNIAYQVQRYAVKDEDEQVRQLVEAKKVQYPMPGQIIVYCGTVQRTKSLGELLGCSAYYREVGDEVAKRRILDRLISGHEQVFTATNALGLGIDRGSIRAVIHVGVPRRMRDFAQESGRGGRDGLASESIIMQPCRMDDRGLLRPTGFPKGVEGAMQSYMSGGECRRVVLDGTMDGRLDRVGCEEGEELCDVCRPRPRRPRRRDPRASSIDGDRPAKRVCREMVRSEIEDEIGHDAERVDPDQVHKSVSDTASEASSETVRVRERKDEDYDRERGDTAGSIDTASPTIFDPDEGRQWIMREVRREQRQRECIEVQELEGKLQEWHDRCPLCAVHGEESHHHLLSACTQPDGVEVQRRSDDLARRVKRRYQKYAACWDCGMPQEICQRWIRRHDGGWRRREGEGLCQFRSHFHIEVVVAIAEYGRAEWGEMLTRWIREDEGTRLEEMEEDEQIQWWGQRIKWGEMETSQLIRNFYRYVSLIEVVGTGS